MNKYLKTYVLIMALALCMPMAALAQTDKELDVNLSDKGFSLVKCDGPAIPPSAGPTPVGYRPCDFKHLMIQVQFIINIMIVLGVVAAIGGFAYAGGLYITGVEKNISKAKGMFPKFALGFILMLTAWFIVSQILTWLTGTSSYLG